MEKEKRLKKIEDRKIEILLGIAEINDNYNKQVFRLNTEYARLDREYYYLKLELFGRKQ